MAVSARVVGLGFSWEVSPPKSGAVRVDRDKILSVIQIIIENSIDYTPSGGSIHAEIYDDNRGAIVKVRDTGVGISREDLAKVFTEFYRGENGRSMRPGGFGIGLFIVKKFIEHHSGEVVIESEKKKGTTVIIRIPFYYTDALPTTR